MLHPILNMSIPFKEQKNTPTELMKRIPKGAMCVFDKNKKNKTFYMARKKYRRRTVPRKRKYILMEADYNFLHHFNVVKDYFLNRENITMSQLEMLFVLNNLGIFTLQDYRDIPFVGRKPMFKKLNDNGYVCRMSLDIKTKYPIYELTTSSKFLVTEFHKMLIGESPLPIRSNIKMSKAASPDNKNVILSKFQKLLG